MDCWCGREITRTLGYVITPEEAYRHVAKESPMHAYCALSIAFFRGSLLAVWFTDDYIKADGGYVLGRKKAIVWCYGGKRLQSWNGRFDHLLDQAFVEEIRKVKPEEMHIRPEHYEHILKGNDEDAWKKFMFT